MTTDPKEANEEEYLVTDAKLTELALHIYDELLSFIPTCQQKTALNGVVCVCDDFINKIKQKGAAHA